MVRSYVYLEFILQLFKFNEKEDDYYSLIKNCAVYIVQYIIYDYLCVLL